MPTAVQIGNNGDDQSYPAIAPASQSAPNDGKFVVAWAVGQKLKLEHIDETGSTVGSSTESMAANIEGLDVVAYGSGYAAFAANATGQLQWLRFDSSLQKQGSKTQLSTKSSPTLKQPAAAVNGKTAWVSYTLDDGGDFIIRAAAVDLSKGNRTTDPFTVSQSGNELPGEGNPGIEIVGGTPTVVWLEPDTMAVNDIIRGARVQTGGSAQNRFQLEVGGKTTAEPEPVDVTGVDGILYAVYPEYSGGTASLKVLAIAPSDTGSLTGGTAITDSSATNRAPSAVPVDPNGDGTAEELAITWEQGNTTDPSIMIGSTSLSSPGKMSGREVEPSGNEPENGGLAKHGGKLGGIWVETNRMDNLVEYVPISIDGVPVCTPNP
jgi:hypothetical protein